MKCLSYSIFLLQFDFMFVMVTSDFNFITSNLPAGEGILDIKAILNCDANQNQKFQINVWLDGTKIKGNVTNNILFDDTLFFEMYIALKVSSDVWKNNVLSQKSQRACTTFKNILGSEWNTFFNPFETRNINNCPLTPGTYLFPESGIDKSFLRNTNVRLKPIVYGLYRVRLSFTRKNEVLGCIVLFINAKKS